MGSKLVAWARAVKARTRTRLPVLWLFTDSARLADPRPAVARLPRGLCGVVLRHDGAPDRARLGRDLAALCRARRLALVVAGDARLAARLRAGVHWRGGRRGLVRLAPGRLVTSSAHGVAQLRRAGGCDTVFLSPEFATASHPEAHGLGVARWCLLARRARARVLALGGVDGASARRLPRWCRGAGAIGALGQRGVAPSRDHERGTRMPVIFDEQ